jgi:GAF domain-containing protein
MPVDPDALQAGIANLAKLGSGDHAVHDVLEEAVEAIHGLFGLSGAGMMLIDDQSALRSVVASDHVGELLEATQRDTGEGPCIDAYVYDVVAACADLGSDPRYRRVGPKLTVDGIFAVLGVPIRLSGSPVGSLNVYVDQPHEWPDDEVDALETYGRLLASQLSSALAAHQRGQIVDQLQYALDYRRVIERAVGYLMARHNIGAVEAFDTLRRAARDRQRRVADVARDLLERRVVL